MINQRILVTYFGKSFFREKGVIIFLVFLPLLLVSVAKASSPEGNIPMNFDDRTLTPEAQSLNIILYSVTAVVFVASIASFFVAFNIKSVIPRLNQIGYSISDIAIGFLLLIAIINFITATVIWIFTMYLIDIKNSVGFYFGLFFASFIFSTIGLIISELVDTKTLGIYAILTLSIMDTTFFENPVFSRRYDSQWISLMPSHASIVILIRSTFDTGINWIEGIGFVVLYEIILIAIYIIIRSKISNYKN